MLCMLCNYLIELSMLHQVLSVCLLSTSLLSSHSLSGQLSCLGLGPRCLQFPPHFGCVLLRTLQLGQDLAVLQDLPQNHTCMSKKLLRSSVSLYNTLSGK